MDQNQNQAPAEPAPTPEAAPAPPPAEASSTPPAATQGQTMDVVPPPEKAAQPAEQPPADSEPGTKEGEKPAEKPVDAQAALKKVAPKQSKSGVTLAIIATVIIVLGLAALATYAYLKTTK